MQLACKKLDLPGIPCHALRHCHATLPDAGGGLLGRLQSPLGHALPEITWQIYLHAIPAELRRSVEEVEKL
ncbi:MAG: hypothetical protein ACREQ5_01310 [Candidatus Dormibacteria bacterium]